MDVERDKAHLRDRRHCAALCCALSSVHRFASVRASPRSSSVLTDAGRRKSVSCRR